MEISPVRRGPSPGRRDGVEACERVSNESVW